jgi:predicted HAD superfamily phosphohydrolase
VEDIFMYETMSLDSNTIIVKSDNKKELSDIVEFISKKGKEKNMEALLKLAAENRKRVKNYKFVRGECYDR